MVLCFDSPPPAPQVASRKSQININNWPTFESEIKLRIGISTARDKETPSREFRCPETAYLSLTLGIFFALYGHATLI